MKRLMKLSIAMCAIIVLSAGCQSGGGGSSANSSSSAKEIYIASANPMTGDSAQFGDIKVKAIEMAIEEFNERDPLNGVQVRLTAGDDTGNPKEAVTV